MSRRRRAPAQNLDSLLDTMANVVGILVILLAVTQISVTQAMKRITGPIDVDERAVAVAEEDARAAAEKRERLAVELAALTPGEEAARDRLARYRDALEEARRRRTTPAMLGLAPDELEQRITRRERDVRHLERAIEQAAQELEQLEQAAPKAEASAPQKIARLPDPRPAPARAESLTFFCRFGRCFHLDDRLMTAQVESAMRTVLGRTTGLGAMSAYERQRLAEHMARNPIGTDEVRIRVFSSGPTGPAGLRLDWRTEDAGETDAELGAPGSAYRKIVTSRSPRAYYFKYYVWADSFDAYTAARELANDLGFAAGWHALDNDADIYFGASGVPEDRVD